MLHPDTPELDQPLAQGRTGAPLTRKESREIVTPYAFEVDHDLWGVPTASPFRRLFAMGIDTAIISAMANASLFVIAIVMSYLIYCRVLAKKTLHVVLCVVVAAVLLSTAYYSPSLLIDDQSQATENELVAGTKAGAAAGALMKAGIAMRKDECTQTCMDQHLDKVVTKFAGKDIDKVAAAELLDGLMDGTDYPAEAWPARREQLLSRLPEPKPVVEPTTVAATPAAADNAWYQPPEGVHSVLEWGKSVLSDIGFGVGWAIFYFTFLVYWCHGQTLGKKLLGIKVIQLDGQELSIFAAFSRQGGYGAGFATGLLGFLQVFWDPNRQAIQDKVVSTVVIRVGQAKRPLTH